jgi:hypothetical protein
MIEFRSNFVLWVFGFRTSPTIGPTYVRAHWRLWYLWFKEEWIS